VQSPQKPIDLKATAAIPEVVISPVRASPRLAKSADENVLQKATTRTAEKNLEDMKGNTDNHSLFFSKS